MPKSKRNKAVTLSKTTKKGKGHKEAVVAAIRQAFEDYSSAYVFTYENMRNQRFKEFREQLKSNSRFFLGSNKVMQIALGRSAADEVKPGSHRLSKLLRGDAGLLLTNMDRDEVHRIFEKYEEHDFARTGSIAPEKVELKEGPLEQFTHEMEPFLRKQGLPVRLNKGVVELVSDFVVCEEGKPLSPESARTLRLLGMKMATFKLHLVCCWTLDDFELYREVQDKLYDGYILGIIAFVIFAKSLQYKPVKKESVIIMRELGVQLETHYWSWKVTHRFVPIAKILRPVLNECVTPITCYWSLSLILHGEEQLMLVFQEVQPPLKMLVPVWKALIASMGREEASSL